MPFFLAILLLSGLQTAGLDPETPGKQQGELAPVTQLDPADQAAVSLPALPPELQSQYLELAELERWAASANPGPLADVTVLLPLKRADPVTASTSVQRTFDRAKAPDMQPVSTSRAIFISGPPVVVLEALTRLRALDDITPEPKVRSRLGKKPAQDADEFEEFMPNDGLSKGVGFLIAGMIGLGLAAVIFLRRMIR
jgi:hypothetical protein